MEDSESRCIGVLLNKCPIPIARCHQCWYANSDGEPTLVRIAVFREIHSKRDDMETLMNFEMNEVERQILADIGKLDLFCWRTRDLIGMELPPDLNLEYEDICKKYDKTGGKAEPHSQVYRIKKSILEKLERDMKNLDRHQPGAWEVANGRIVSVSCVCGETTKYKVPLKVISDFCCPKEKQYARRQRTSSRT